MEDRAALLSFVCEQVHPSDLSTFLDMDGVPSVLDITLPTVQGVGILAFGKGKFVIYNTKEDVDIFVENLEETLALDPSARMEEMTRKTMIPLSLLYERLVMILAYAFGTGKGCVYNIKS